MWGYDKMVILDMYEHCVTLHMINDYQQPLLGKSPFETLMLIICDPEW